MFHQYLLGSLACDVEHILEYWLKFGKGQMVHLPEDKVQKQISFNSNYYSFVFTEFQMISNYSKYFPYILVDCQWKNYPNYNNSCTLGIKNQITSMQPYVRCNMIGIVSCNMMWIL
jgi:hypothetical protein